MKKIAIEEHVNESDLSNFDQRIRDMDEAGIDMQVLSYAFIYDEGETAGAVEAAKKTNDALARMVDKNPERFRAFTVLALHNLEEAANELERTVTQFGFAGGMVFGSFEGEFLDNPRYLPLFERAEKLDVPIYIHPAAPPPDMIKYYSVYPGLEGAILGFSAQNSLQAMRMILSGLFEKYPSLKIILGHMGEGLPYWLWRIDSRWMEARERDPDADKLYKNFKKSPAQFFRDNFYVTTSGMFWLPPLECAIAAMGADRVLFAVDYPPESITDGAAFIESAPIDEKVKEKICHLNAERLLKIP